MRAIRDAGYGMALITGRDYSPGPEWDLKDIRVYRVRSLVKYLSPRRDLWSLVHLCRLIRHIRPDGVHTHLAKAGILGRWAAHLCGVPVIIHTVHGPTFPATLPILRRAIFRGLERATGRITDHFVFVGEDVRSEYVESGVCRMDNSSVVRTGRPDAEIDELQCMEEEERSGLRSAILQEGGDRVLIANVGRVVPSKQQDHAIRVLQELRHKGVKAHLVVIGEGFLKEEKGFLESLRALAEKVGVADHVTFTGHREDALRIMAASDAVLHTSRHEGLSNILVEAALAGTPVVTYAVSGAREVIRDGETGFIVSQGDIRTAADRLYYLATHGPEAREMGFRAREAISGEYRESRMIQRKLDFYERVFRARKDPGKASPV
jgi:glycosyltransferase involved in cell wall biosynthesis